MTQQNAHPSEIAKFFAQWDLEVEAMQLALNGLAITGKHDVITHRMQSFADKIPEMKSFNVQQEGRSTPHTTTSYGYVKHAFISESVALYTVPYR